MTEQAGERTGPARHVLLVSTDDAVHDVGLEFDSATVVRADELPSAWPAEPVAGLYLDLNPSLREGLLAHVFERAAEQDGCSVLLHLRGDVESFPWRAALDARSQEWVVSGVRPAADGAVVELARSSKDVEDAAEPDGESGLGQLIAGIAAALGRHDEVRRERTRLAQELDAAEAQIRRLRDAGEDQRVEIVSLQDKLQAEWRLRRDTQAQLAKARSDLEHTRDRMQRLESTPALRATRRYWRVRAGARRRLGRFRLRRPRRMS